MRALLTLSLLGAAAPLLASEPAAAEQAQPGADKEKLICRRENVIGSIIPARRKMCLTKSEWERREYDGNEAARKMVQDNAGKCGGPVC